MPKPKKKPDVRCAYCGTDGEGGPEIRKCRCCERPVCWSPTCRGARTLPGDPLCATCTKTLPEVAGGDYEFTCGECPICDEQLQFVAVVDIHGSTSLDPVGTLQANAYACPRGHTTITADHGNSTKLDRLVFG